MNDSVPIRPLVCVVLAAGEGTRMRSATPKVLHPVCGRSLVGHVVDALLGCAPTRCIVVVGNGADAVREDLVATTATETPLEFVEQRQRRGTGHATRLAVDADVPGRDDEDVLVVAGDTPLLASTTVQRLVDEHRASGAAATLLTAVIDDPTGYGRVVRDARGVVIRIVEERDASDEERAIHEVNTSIYCFGRERLAAALDRLAPDNAQGELYLTDVIAILHEDDHEVHAVVLDDPMEAAGVNDRVQLADVERAMRDRINTHWMRSGVTMVDPDRTYVDVGVELDADVRLWPGTLLQGRTSVGRGSEIGPDARLVDTVVGEDSVIQQCVTRGVEMGDRVRVGPYAHLRPGTRLADDVHVGSYVETKNAEVGEGAKIPHLSYVGDATVGSRANVGAGTITANYDGKNKHRTVIGADTRTGSNSVLVAPVQVGDGAYVAAGAVVTKDVPEGALAKGVPAVNVEGWVAKNR
ncbi:MAG: bifunctional UDP-N-acetylglucosamine diphosphorylase/glucosamine-1-phosphate N-acetyltransferase GlmU [Acidimicrobiia bacterium]